MKVGSKVLRMEKVVIFNKAKNFKDKGHQMLQTKGLPMIRFQTQILIVVMVD